MFVAGISFFLLQPTYEEKIEKVVSETKKEMAENYVDLCLKKGTEEAIVTMAKRGGYLPGKVKNPHPISNSISIALENMNDGNTSPASYPTTNFSIYSGEHFPFGNVNLKMLCQEGGPNDVPIIDYAIPCPSGSYGLDSMQKDIVHYVSLYLEKCVPVPLEEISKVSGFEISINQSERPKVTVTFGEEGLLAQAYYPFIFEQEDERLSKTVEFSYEVPIRLKRLYGLADFLIKNDRYYIDFNISKDYFSEKKRSKHYDTAMSVIVTPIDQSDNKTDVIFVYDNKSIMQGRAVYFKFARENRPPVLEPIHPSTFTDEAGEVFDVVASGTDVNFTIDGADPDEDKMYVALALWRIHSNSTMNPFCDTSDGYFACMENPQFGPQRRPTHDGNTLSDVFPLEKGMEINFDVIPEDRGAHKLLVMLGDDKKIMEEIMALTNPANLASYAPLVDYQLLNILVLNEDIVQEPGEDCYFDEAVCPECCGEHISTEDPIIADATGSISSTGFYDWSINGFEDTANQPRVILPFDHIDYLGIENINDVLSLSEGFEDLILTIGDEDPVEQTKEVHQCFNYSADNYASFPPWPYNITDPFLSAHSCCIGDEFAPKSKECFNDKWLGSLYSFNKTKYLKGPTPIEYEIILETSTISNKASDNVIDFISDKLLRNDAYETTISRQCSGSRGNICTGKIVETVKNKLECGGDNLALDETCAGAKVSLSATLASSCEVYPAGMTFEKKYADRGVSVKARNGLDPVGACNHAFEPSTVGTTINKGTYKFSSGKWACQGGCNGMVACTVGVNCKCDSTVVTTTDPACDGLLFETMSGKDLVLHEGAYCDRDCNEVSASEYDSNPTACRAEYGNDAWDPVRPANRRCCGNDPEEQPNAIVGHACCKNNKGCDNNGECIEHNQQDTDSTPSSLTSKLCKDGSIDTCTWKDECKVKDIGSTHWKCTRGGWEILEGKTTSKNDQCGKGPPSIDGIFCGVCDNPYGGPYKCVKSSCPPQFSYCYENPATNQFVCFATS